ncbi:MULTISPECIES: class D beta-lactamase [unclassified Mesorhizobium]|uniref:class D beta-lactamase n=1 Tax=unclassified Mesorhizobium TaxID=325217 RepID=UPI000BAE9DE6|nr:MULTISPECIES: class D beta-lactamase [unclassified Mesorhizobium]TGT59550.1 class D beta-lactamase [Mesorhizobium sp. M00.F.Ca.ET.170.01.1.1]AZO12556.1 class D beta-lactamase [Mesorhizobium sp. M3A.F.Ca.ET.080.04.2.1]PBB86027.1 class D beta-lactamase [Mesorhizobium sp. WSM3876]RWB68441.1 MAG: class D beta-lactamase [Mesorhizobium sp.]RWB91028.1 MAG: class D beta-lactamase [Mesorhizobium sp.]
MRQMDRYPFIFAVVLFLLAWMLGLPMRAQSAPLADIHCTLIQDAESGATLYQDGICDQRASPASTFKVPLALMGYDSGILSDEHTPSWDYKAEFNAVKRDQKTVDPIIWERDSIIWYSREITRRLGADRFAGYVSKFGYGNADVSGSAGKNDGLTNSWVDSSLEISPVEQAAFLRSLLAGKMPASAKAQELARAIIPSFNAGDWTVQGKTGTTRIGSSKRSLGWFIGWAEKDGRRIVFARLVADATRGNMPKGPATRAAFLKDLPALIK